MSENPSSDWYLNFFTELPIEFWRSAVSAEVTQAEADFVERHLGLAPGSRIVDVPCGSGRHSLSLASRGHHVAGVDISLEANRINWNLGIDYDSNQYGRPVGDGKIPRGGWLRLDRRGPYFAAYYRNEVEVPDWVCGRGPQRFAESCRLPALRRETLAAGG